MAANRRPRGTGHTERGKALTDDEIKTIQLLHQRGTRPAEIARLIGRGRASVYRWIQRGQVDQQVMDFGHDCD